MKKRRKPLLFPFKKAVTSLILITLVAYIAIGIDIFLKPCISHIWPKIQFPIAIYTNSVIKLHIRKAEHLHNH